LPKELKPGDILYRVHFNGKIEKEIYGYEWGYDETDIKYWFVFKEREYAQEYVDKLQKFNEEFLETIKGDD